MGGHWKGPAAAANEGRGAMRMGGGLPSKGGAWMRPGQGCGAGTTG